MGEQVIARRHALRDAALAAGGAAVAGLGVSTTARAGGHDDRHGDRDIEGSWLIVRQDDGDPTEVTAVLSFADGGVVISHDILPAGPPFTGTWDSDDHRVRATFYTGFPGEEGPGSPGAVVRVRLRGRVRHDEISATYRVKVFVDDEVVESATGSFRGERIDA